MADLYPAARFASDTQCLIDRGHNRAALRSHVRCVDAAMVGGHLGEFDDLFGAAPLAGRVNQTRGKPDCAVEHRLIHHRPGPGHLLGSEFAAHTAFDGAQHCVVAVKRRGIHSHTAGHQIVEVRLDIAHARTAVAGDDSGHAIANEVFGPGQLVEIVVGVGVDVDKAWCDCPLLCIDLPSSACVTEVADSGDLSISNCNIAINRLRAGSINNARVNDHQIKHRVGGRCAAVRADIGPGCAPHNPHGKQQASKAVSHAC